MIRALVVAVVLWPMVASAQMWPNPGPGRAAFGGGGGGGTDWSADTECEAYYPFEGASGTGEGERYNDECDATPDNDLADLGTPSLGFVTSGCTQGSQCFDTDGTDAEGLTTADDSTIEPSTITYGCMIYRDTASDGVAFSKYNTNGWTIYLESDGDIHADVGAVNSNTSGATGVPISTWTSIIVRWQYNADSGQIDIFKNGSEVTYGTHATQTSNSAQLSTAAMIVSGLASPSTYTLFGVVDDCFVLNQLLTDAEICGIARYGFDGTTSDRGYGCSL